MAILFPTDFSKGCRAAQRAAVDMAIEKKLPLRVLFVVDTRTHDCEDYVDPLTHATCNDAEDLEKFAERQFADFKNHIGDLIDLEFAIRKGSPEKEIVAEAVDNDTEAIILPVDTQCRAVYRAVHGSVGQYVQSHAPCGVRLVSESGDCT